MIHNILRLSVFSSFILFSSNVYAQNSYVGPLNIGLGNGASIWCSACHTDGGSKGSATLPMAGTWRSGANLALSDSDGDGFNNRQEVSGASTNFNYNTISPFTLAKAAEGSSSAKVVVVNNAGVFTETGIVDVYAQVGIRLAAGHEVAGAVSPLVNTFPATIFFNKAVNAGDKVYVVDHVFHSNTLLNTGVVFNANGSVTISGVAGPADIVVDRVIPIVPTSGAPRGGGEDEEGLECLVGQLSTPLMMFLAMLSLGLMVKRKKV